MSNANNYFIAVVPTCSQKVAGVMGTVTTVNNTLSSEVDKLRFLMKNLLKEVKKHMVS